MGSTVVYESTVLRALLIVLVAAVFAGCPHASPSANEVATLRNEGLSGARDGGDDPALMKLDALETEASQALAEADEALWVHWTSGSPLTLKQGHESLFSKATLDFLRAQKSVRARHLEAFVVSELLSRALTSDTEAVASLEASATFPLDGKDVAWRDVPRLLVTEKSAVKRRALWNASGQVVERLDALLAHREDKAREVLASLGVPSSLDLWASVRELDLEATAADARTFLALTDDAWRDTLVQLSNAELKLPVDALTRADLPRLLKVPASVDAVFPKAQVAPWAIDTLTGLGVYGRPGLTLDFTDAAKKKPLPLTVAPRRDDVRVAFKPAGGLRDVTLLLSELGAALALHGARTGHVTTDRLGDPARPLVLSALLASLVAEPKWLEARQVPDPLQPEVVRAAHAQWLYSLRRASLQILLRVETAGLPDGDARLKAQQIIGHALGVKVSADDGARLRLELDEGLRSGSVLKAALEAATERDRLGDTWWQTAQGFAALEPRLAAGTAYAPAPTPRRQALEALVRQLGVGLAAPVDGGVPAATP